MPNSNTVLNKEKRRAIFRLTREDLGSILSYMKTMGIPLNFTEMEVDSIWIEVMEDYDKLEVIYAT